MIHYFHVSTILVRLSHTTAVRLSKKASLPPENNISGTFIPAHLFHWEETGRMTHGRTLHHEKVLHETDRRLDED